MFRYFKKKITKRSIDILQDIASKQQNTMLLTAEVSKWLLKILAKKNETQIWVNLYEKRPSHKQRKRSKFNLGDLRLTIEKAFLMNRYQEIWTNELFIIEAIVYGNPTTHKIKYQDNEPIKGAIYQQKSFS